MITTYQIRNVLRIYGNQLKKRAILSRDSTAPSNQPADFVDISVEARRKQMFDKISNNIMSQITKNNHQPRTEANLSGDRIPLKQT